MDYKIPEATKLSDVYRMWLIAIEPEKFASENNLTSEQLFRFRGLDLVTWGEFTEKGEANMKGHNK